MKFSLLVITVILYKKVRGDAEGLAHDLPGIIVAFSPTAQTEKH